MINLDEFNKKQNEKEKQKEDQINNKTNNDLLTVSYQKAVQSDIDHDQNEDKPVDQEWKEWEKFFASNSAIYYIFLLIVLESFFLFKFITQLDSVAFFSLFIMPFFIIPIVILWPLGDYFGLTAEYPWNILYFIFLVIRIIITLFFYEKIFNLLPDKVKNF